MHDNEELCGPLVSVRTALGTGLALYEDVTTDTNLGNACPQVLPCCEELRLNPVFCCIEARNPAFALSVCEECP